MRPMLPVGARVELRPLRPGESLTGAIVAVDAGELVVVHRVRRDAGHALQTQGIARHVADPWWPRDAVIGVASSVQSRGGAALRSEAVLRALCAAAVAAQLRWLYRAARLARRF